MQTHSSTMQKNQKQDAQKERASSSQMEKIKRYARKKPGDDTLYYLPEFEVLYSEGKPTLIYKPIQLKLRPVSTDEINNVLQQFNDENTWIPVDEKHYKQIEGLYGSEPGEDNASFFAKLRQANGMQTYDDTLARRSYVTFESFYQLAAMPNKKII